MPNLIADSKLYLLMFQSNSNVMPVKTQNIL